MKFIINKQYVQVNEMNYQKLYVQVYKMHYKKPHVECGDKMQKKISTRQHHAKHPFAGQSTQQL